MVEKGSFCSTENRQSFFRNYILLFLPILVILPSGHSCTRSPTLIRCTLRRTQFEFQTHAARVQYLPRSMNSLVFTAWIQKNKLVGPPCLFEKRAYRTHFFSCSGHIIIIDAASSLEANDLRDSHSTV